MIFILTKVRNFIEKNNLIESGDTVIVGFSGGADSVFLLHTLHRLKDKLDIKLVAAHINHMLRGEEAQRDAEFAQKFSKELDIPFHLYEADVNKIAEEEKISAEEAGRKVRYEFFNSLCAKYENAKIATAHNKNDNAETILLHMIRGSGITGLCGIPCKRQNIVRPILDITRKEIEEYCKTNKLLFVTDSTNLEDVYTRNKVRLKLIPLMEELNPNIISTLCNMGKNLSLDNAFIDSNMENFKEHINDNKIKISELQKLLPAVSRRLIKYVAEKGGAKPENIHIDKIIDMINNPVTGKKIDIPGGKVCISYDNLVFGDTFTTDDYCIKIENPCDINVCGYAIKSDKNGNFRFPVNAVIEIRNRRAGDKIKAGGMTKKVKKIFIDKKIPENKRNSYPIITANGEPVCILGLVKGDYFKEFNINEDTFVLNIHKEVHTNE